MHLCIERIRDTIEVLILPHKTTGKYSFINLTKGHICPCMFNSIDEALQDLQNYPDILRWTILEK